MATVSSILMIIAVVSYFLLKSSEMKRYEVALSDLDKQVEIIMRDPIFSYDLNVLQKIVDSYTPNPWVAEIRVLDQKGREMVGAKSNKPISEVRDLEVIYDNNKLIGTINVAYSREPVNEILSGKIKNSIINMFITLTILSALLVAFIRHIFVNPIKKVSKTISSVHKNGCFDLTASADINSQDEIGILSRSYNNLLGSVSNTLSSVATNIVDVGNWVNNFEEISRSTTATTVQQKQNTQNAMSHVHSLQEAIQGILQNSDLTATDCRESLNVAIERRHDVEESLTISRNLVDELNINADRATELKSASDTIGGVLDVIKSIAEQTNLLALNAAIEAARAGESGRGFAVVADEVRTLAQRTQESTSQIEKIIGELQEKAEDAYTSTQRGQSLANNGITLTEKSAESFHYLSDKLKSINTNIDQVVAAAKQQSDLSNEVNAHMQHALDGSESLADEMGKMHSHSELVVAAEQQLSNNLSKFKF